MERLRHLYADLLDHIDVTNEELGPRRAMLDHDGHHAGSLHWGHALFWNQYIWRRAIFAIQYDKDEPDDDNDNNSSSSALKRKRAELASAFRVLSATRSPDKEGDNFGAIAVRDDSTVAALALARAIESKVVALVANIGDVVIQSDRQVDHHHLSNKLGFLRSDAVFEYFCEKAIFSLLIEIAKEKPTSTALYNTTTNVSYMTNSHVRHNGSTSCFHGVVWSPLVKAQVLQTVSTLVSSVRDMSALFYLLSNNFINELILCMLPTTQWTDPALVKIMPAYVQLLRNLTLQLAGSPSHLFPFMIVSPSEDSASPPSFPLFSAALEVAMSSYALSDSFVHLTCLHVIVNLLQIPQGPLRVWISCHAEVEQKKLAAHLCQRLVDRFHRLVNLCTGPAVDAIRSNSMVGQLTDLSDQLNFLNLFFSCDVLGLSVRICETLLQRVVSVLLYHLLPKERQFLVVGVMDGDVIPQREALAQVSMVVLAQMMTKLEYTPFLRMLAVAIFHPLSPSPRVWHHGIDDSPSVHPVGSRRTTLDEYVLTPALNAVVQANGFTDDGLIRNPFREEIVKTLSGELGEWRFVAAAVLLESGLTCEALDTNTQASLDVLPNFHDNKYCASSLELALGKFLARDHQRLSAVSTMALECAGSLSMSLISQVATTIADHGLTDPSYNLLNRSPVVKELWRVRNYFCAKSLECSTQAGVSEIFIELVESAVLNRYQDVYPNHHQQISTGFHGKNKYANHLNRYGCQKAIAPKSGILVRKLKGVSFNDVESARFHIQMALHFRSICRVVEDAVNNLHHWNESPMTSLAQLDEADDLILSIGGLTPRPSVGMDIDLRGRMAFGILASSNEKPSTGHEDDELNLSRNGIFRPSSRHLVLVLDPTDILVIQPMNRSEVNRGTVVCSIPLRSVIAFASDGEWLHLAIRNVQDVGFLIKNGKLSR